MRTPATGSSEAPMMIEYILGAIVTLALFAYLVYALLRPERF
jgi:K+-transporting ATPase KdpF subunit